MMSLPTTIREGWCVCSMLHIKIVAVGTLRDEWQRLGCEEYKKRMGAFCRLQIIEVPETKLPKNAGAAQIAAALQAEGRRITEQAKGSGLIALCIEGEAVDSQELSQKIQRFASNGTGSLAFCIGSSHGLSDEVKNAAVWKLSMSKLTFPHQLARLMLCEQLYRALSITAGTPYHK